MLIDSHVHLQPHGQRPPVDRARIEAYVEHAQRAGIDVIVFTEHLFRFHEAYKLLDGWWDADPDPMLAAAARKYWDDHVNLSMAEYVRLIEEAKSAGLPVRLGLELDWIPGRADDLRRLLAPYQWDCVLGSVHWLGSFGLDDDVGRLEWDRRDVTAVWEEYTQFVEDLADARLCDVLAHPDLAKVWNRRPPQEAPFRRRLVDAAAKNGLALEINTNGLIKPHGELYPHPEMLERARRAGVPVTIGSDAHVPERIGLAFDRALEAARAAGYRQYHAFVSRSPVILDLPI